MRKIAYILVFLLFVSFTSALTTSARQPRVIHTDGMRFLIDSLEAEVRSNPTHTDAIRQLGLLALDVLNDTLARECGQRLMQLGEICEDDRLNTYGCLIFGRAVLMKGESDEGYKYICRSRAIAENRGDSLALASIFKGMADYARDYLDDFAGTLSYYYKGIACAKAVGNERLVNQMLLSIADCYIGRNDTAALACSRDALKSAESRGDDYQQYCSLLCIARIYSTLRDYTQSFLYLNRAEELLPVVSAVNVADFYCLKAKLYGNIGDTARAEMFFGLAKQESDRQSSRYLNILNQEADFEYGRDRFGRASELLDSVLMLSSDSIHAKARLVALWAYSYVCQKCGDYEGALRYSRDFAALRSKAYSSASARMMSEAESRYRFDEMARSLSDHKISMLRQTRKLYVILLVVAILVIMLVTFGISHVRLRRLYRSIVQQVKTSIDTEDRLRAMVRELEAAKDRLQTDDVKSVSVAENNLEWIAESVVKLFEDNPVYTDHTLTRDSLAEIIGTNPVYLTKSIGETFHMGFPQFVNSYRIRMAIRLLSDADDNTPIKAIGLKVGFSSPTSFYNHFKEATGMTPAAFRQSSTGH